MKLYGFTLLRNGVKYDYPFRESLRSLSSLCERVYVALGNSEDNTAQTLSEFTNLEILPTVWDENLRKSGLVLSQQTNIALSALRTAHPDAWGIYLQADEVLSEQDFSRIRDDIAIADHSGCDAVSFRYLHFWQSYDRVAIAKRWYPQEIRAIRLGSEAKSYGDAQSFTPVQKRFESDAFVYHYGHVREASAYQQKKADFNRWWHSDSEMAKVLAKGVRRDKHEPTISYLGPHPMFMKERMAKHQPANKENRKKVLVFGAPEDLPAELHSRVEADLDWTTDFSRVFSAGSANTVFLRDLPGWAMLLRPLGFGSAVPPSMHSPQARDWTSSFQALLRFSEKGIPVS